MTITICDRLKQLRKNGKLTQKEISDILGCSQVTYSNYETGKRDIPHEHMEILSEYYHVSLSQTSGKR